MYHAVRNLKHICTKFHINDLCKTCEPRGRANFDGGAEGAII